MKPKFEPAFRRLMEMEGGFVYHRVAGDKGKDTFAGITRRAFPDWEGWTVIDDTDMRPNDSHAEIPQSLPPLVRVFYRREYWDKLLCDDIIDNEVACDLFCAAVVQGKRTAVRLAQEAIQHVLPDGIMGPKTLEALNARPPLAFCLRFERVRVHRYMQICQRDKTQIKFLLGWLNRVFDRSVL